MSYCQFFLFVRFIIFKMFDKVLNEKKNMGTALKKEFKQANLIKKCILKVTDVK